MKLITPDTARLVEFIYADEMRPTPGSGSNSLEMVLAMIQERYSFVQMPTVKQLLEGNANFVGGQFAANEKTYIVKEVMTTPSALIIDTMTSDACKLFFNDLVQWGQAELGWRKPWTRPKARNFSGVIVEFDEAVEKRIESFSRLCELFSSALKAEYEIDQPYFMKTLAFGADPAKLPAGSMQTDILIQRRTDFPYEGGRYYVTGPFETDKLLALLERAESLMLGTAT